MQRDIPAGWPAYPPELLKAIRAAVPEAAKLRFDLLDGAVLNSTRVLEETELGIVLESADGTVSAVPWHMIARIEAQRADAGKSVGFRTA